MVSHGGRPGLAGEALPMVHTPTLLIVGGADYRVIELNKEALRHMRAPKALEVVTSTTHLFPEPAAVDAVIQHAATWIERYLADSYAKGAQ